MKEIKSISNAWEVYSFLKNEEFNERYLPIEKLEKELLKLPADFNLKTEGFSVLKNPIRSVRFGNGKTKVLLWSQMHGNETTTTKAVFDLFKAFENPQNHKFFQEISSNCTLKIIPVLNPDGAKAYKRENANKIDLNRDAQALSQPESRVLDKVFNEFKPGFCFNLHDQRTIYSAGNQARSAIVSFLSPAADLEKSLTETRKIAMHHIAEINNCLQKHVPGHIGRYDDTFNADCVGDKFQSLSVPTLLFEAGHYPKDYQREKTRKLIFVALLKALSSISKNPFSKIGFDKYQKIPKNKKLFFDLLLRNVCLKGKNCDIAIQLEEKLENQRIKFVPVLKEIVDLSNFFGHWEVEGAGRDLTLNDTEDVEIGMEIKKITLGNSAILLNFIK